MELSQAIRNLLEICFGAAYLVGAVYHLVNSYKDAEGFFERYHEIRPIKPGLMSERRHIYNLYPLLVHVRLFGGGYVTSVSQTLSQFGY